MRKTAATLLFCLLAACGGSEPAETPEAAATRFIEALQSGDTEDIYASIVSGEVSSFEKADAKLDFNRWDDCNIEEFKIGSVEFAGNRAKVTVSVTREIGDEEVTADEYVTCLQEKGQWKVTMSDSSRSFMPSGKRPD